MWKVGSELQSTALVPLDPVDPLDRLDPEMNSKSCKFVAQACKNEPDVVLARDVSCEMLGLETIFRQLPSRNRLKTDGFA